MVDIWFVFVLETVRDACKKEVEKMGSATKIQTEEWSDMHRYAAR
jgi:hypothetical protein